jgi:hypothetical protein
LMLLIALICVGIDATLPCSISNKASTILGPSDWLSGLGSRKVEANSVCDARGRQCEVA